MAGGFQRLLVGGDLSIERLGIGHDEVTEDGALCSRCDQVVAGMDALA